MDANTYFLNQHLIESEAEAVAEQEIQNPSSIFYAYDPENFAEALRDIQEKEIGNLIFNINNPLALSKALKKVVEDYWFDIAKLSEMRRNK
jgi:hypothetical protein